MSFYSELARKTGNKYKTSDPFIIAEKNGIDIKYKNFEMEPKGEAVKYFERSIIILDESLLYSEMKYFVCAHELCHALEHTDLSNYYISNCIIKNKFEYQADDFAKTLLTNLYKEHYDELPETYAKLQIAYGLPAMSI